MTYRSIVVHVDDSDQTDLRLDAATRLARHYPAELTGAYIVSTRDLTATESALRQLIARYSVPTRLDEPVLDLLTTVFREIRAGRSEDGVSLKQPSTTLSTAEAIAVALDAALHARFFGNGQVGADTVARQLVGSVVKEDLADLAVLREYVQLIAKKRAQQAGPWRDFHHAAEAALR